MPAIKSIKKTTIELTREQYIFLKEKVLELQKQNKSASVVSIIRGFIDQAMRKDKKVK
ncbi:MAG: hypothetical protein JW976_06910 [Syntrophaceae bacterium]|nr:hypothetical protein [Syntrophaceae bacterium]